MVRGSAEGPVEPAKLGVRASVVRTVPHHRPLRLAGVACRVSSPEKECRNGPARTLRRSARAQRALDAGVFRGYPVAGPAAWWAAFVIILTLIITVIWFGLGAVAWSRIAAFLMVPYLAWLLFAASLNLAIPLLN